MWARRYAGSSLILNQKLPGHSRSLCCGERRLEQVRVVEVEVAACPHDLHARAEGEVGLQQVLLGQEPVSIEYP